MTLVMGAENSVESSKLIEKMKLIDDPDFKIHMDSVQNGTRWK